MTSKVKGTNKEQLTPKKGSSSTALTSSSIVASKLIAEVKKYELLYDVNHEDYKDATKVRNAWLKVAKAVGSPGDIRGAKERWRRLRDVYVRNRKFVLSRNMSVKPRWKYYDQMSYLNNCIWHKLPWDPPPTEATNVIHLIEKDDDIVDCGEDGSESNSSRNHEEQDAVNPLQDVDDISTNRTKSSQDKIWDITEYGESADEDNSNQGGESHSSVNMELMNGKIIKPPRVPINQVPVLHYTFNQMNNTVTSEVLPLQLQNPSNKKTSNTPKDPSPFSEQDLLKRMSPDSNFQPIAVPVTASLTLSSNSNQPDVNNLMATGQPQPRAIAVPVTASLTLSSNNNQTDVNNLMATGQPELRAIAVPVTAPLALSSNNNQTDVNNLMTTGQPQLRAIAVPVTAPLSLSSNSNQPDVNNLMATGQPQLQAIAVPVTAPLVHPFHNNYPHATNLTSVRQSQLQPIAVSAAAPLTLSSMPTNTFIQQQQMPREEEELYGSYVAAAIRKMSNRSKSLAKMRIQQVIFELEEIERETQT